MERKAYDFIAFKNTINTPYASIYHVSGGKGVVYYCRDGIYYASAHELLARVGTYDENLGSKLPDKMWRVTHSEQCQNIEDLWEVYCHEIESEWLR